MPLPHGVPDFAADPRTIHTFKSGDWSDPAIWDFDIGECPGPDDYVCIDPGHIVATSLARGPIDVTMLAVQGQFSNADGVPIRVHTLVEYPGGSVAITGRCDLTIKAGPFLDNDPEEYSRGILLMGSAAFVGEAKTPYERTATPMLAGAGSIVMVNPPAGWQVGDEILIPDTRPYTGGGHVFQCEVRKIKALGGQIVFLDAPLSFSHLPAKNRTGQVEAFPHVANLTRSIRVQPEDLMQPGHIWIHGAARIHGCEIYGMGRTTVDPASRLGRYPLHTHHGAPADWQGNSIHRPTDLKTDIKWDMTCHDSHWGAIRQNVIYGFGGAGIAFEDGCETGNTVEENMVVLGNGTAGHGGDEKQLGIDGSGIWGGGQNTVRNNVVYCSRSAGIVGMGKEGATVSVPTFPGQPRPDWPTVSSEDLQFAELSGNEVWCCEDSLQIWHMGESGPDANRATGFRVYHCLIGVNPYYEMSGYEIDDWVIVGGHKKSTGLVYGGAHCPVLAASNVRMEFVGVGIAERARGVATKGMYTNFDIHATKLGVSIENWMQNPEHDLQMHFFDGVKITAPVLYSFTGFGPSRPPHNEGITKRMTITVTNHQGVSGDNFRLYAIGQAPDFIIPAFDGAPAGVVGLTNAAAVAAGFSPIGGEIVPAGAVLNPAGFVGYKK